MEQPPEPPNLDRIAGIAALGAIAGASCGFTLAGLIGVAAGMTTEFLGLTGNTSFYLFAAIGGVLGLAIALFAFSSPPQK